VLRYRYEGTDQLAFQVLKVWTLSLSAVLLSGIEPTGGRYSGVGKRKQSSSIGLDPTHVFGVGFRRQEEC
jgi:hypothetical protein